MNKEIETFGGTEIEKRKFHYSKYLIDTNNVEADKIIISKQGFFW